MRVKIRVGDNIIERKPKFHVFGNFLMATVRYKNKEYLLGGWDGDEYFRGIENEKIYTLGKNMESDNDE